MLATVFRQPPHLMTLADLSVHNINALLVHAAHLKRVFSPLLRPAGAQALKAPRHRKHSVSLQNKTIALLFSKRSTRTRISAETAADLLGGRALFLGKEDIQLGVNESVRDSARVISGMTQGIFARVGDHSEITVRSSLSVPRACCFTYPSLQELAKYSKVPVINALSSLWHPTQVLADLLTLREVPSLTVEGEGHLKRLRPLTVTYVGDSANVLHDMLVTYPRLGHKLRVASPEKYRAPPEVWDRVTQLECDKHIFWTADPREAVHGADVVVTDTWCVLFPICFGLSRLSMRVQDLDGPGSREGAALEGFPGIPGHRAALQRGWREARLEVPPLSAAKGTRS